MRFVFAALILVFLVPSAHAQTVDDDEYEDLEFFCIFFDDDEACDLLDKIDGLDTPAPNEGDRARSTEGPTASLEICNRTTVTAFVAIGEDVGPVDGDLFRSQGWWSLTSNECKDFWTWPVRDAVNNVPLFFLVYAEDDEGGVWDGDDVFLCTPDEEFDIIGDHEGDCRKRGYFDIDIFEGDLLETGYTLNLRP